MPIATIRKHRFTILVVLQAVLMLLICLYSYLSQPEPPAPDKRPRRTSATQPYPGKTWHKPSDNYPGGMLAVTMNGTHFEVPGEPEYLAQMPYNREFFDVYLLWTEWRSERSYETNLYPKRPFDHIWAGFSISRRWSEQSPDQRSKPFHIDPETIGNPRYEQVSKENPDLLANLFLITHEPQPLHSPISCCKPGKYVNALSLSGQNTLDSRRRALVIVSATQLRYSLHRSAV